MKQKNLYPWLHVYHPVSTYFRDRNTVGRLRLGSEVRLKNLILRVSTGNPVYVFVLKWMIR